MTVGKRAVQIARIGLAARRVRKSQTEEQKQRALKALSTLFADARGATMKIGQLFAGLNSESPLAELVTGIEPLPLEQILPALESGLGRTADSVFAELDEAQAAASLGQVHHATLKDGTAVAVKVQYPGIAEAVDAELRLAGFLPSMGPARKWDFALDGYKAALRENLTRELDYRSEARRQETFGRLVRIPGLVVPRVYPEFTSQTTLVQEWQTGVRLDEVAEWPAAARNEVGRILLGTLFKSLFELGEVHGDPHLGNSFYRMGQGGKPEVVLLDFGCTLPVDQLARLALLKLILGLRADTALPFLQLFGAIGFDVKKLSRIGGTLPLLSKVLLHPFVAGRPFFVSEWDLGNRFEAALGEDRWWFRSAGAPASILLMRAFQGVTQQLDRIKARVDWAEVLDTSVSREIRQQAEALVLPELSPACLAADSADILQPARMSHQLKVLVREGTQQIAAISMPAEAALELETLMPDDVLQDVRASGQIDLEATAARLRSTGLRPQDILEFTRGARTYRIWLE